MKLSAPVIEDLITYIRFPFLLNSSLLTIQNSPLYNSYSDLFQDFIPESFKYRALKTDISDPQTSLPQHMLRARNYTNPSLHICEQLQAPLYVTLPVENSKISKSFSIPAAQYSQHSSKLDVTLNSKGDFSTKLIASYVQAYPVTQKIKIFMENTTKLRLGVTDIEVTVNKCSTHLPSNTKYTYRHLLLRQKHNFRQNSFLILENFLPLWNILYSDPSFLPEDHLTLHLFIKPTSFKQIP